MEHIVLETEHPIAADSPDHLYPYGTAMIYPINGRFIDKMKRLFSDKPFTEIKALDLGCGGGTFVQTLIDRGLFAVGLEGSDFSKQRKRAAWKFFSDQFLFTCDITYRFNLTFQKKESILFDLITAWEVMEHIPEEKIDTVIVNMKRHLAPLGLVILSISNEDSIYFGHQLHLCQRPKEWWVQKFKSAGLYHLDAYKGYFNDQYIAGPKLLPHCFNLVLSNDPENYRKPPKITLKEKMVDKWVHSKWHHKVTRLFTLHQ